MVLLTSQDKIEVRLSLLSKYGNYVCNNCNLSPEDLILNKQNGSILIDHIDNNNHNNDIDNLQHLCHSCNTKKNHPRNNFLNTNLEIENSDKIEFKVRKQYLRKTILYIEGLLEIGDSKIDYNSVLVSNICANVGCCEKTAKENLRTLTASDGGVFKSFTGNFDQYYLKKLD